MDQRELIEKEGWSVSIGTLMAYLKQKLKWADQSSLKQELDHQLEQLLGPKPAPVKQEKVPHYFSNLY